jgi:hypothetical protein
MQIKSGNKFFSLLRAFPKGVTATQKKQAQSGVIRRWGKESKETLV